MAAFHGWNPKLLYQHTQNVANVMVLVEGAGFRERNLPTQRPSSLKAQQALIQLHPPGCHGRRCSCAQTIFMIMMEVILKLSVMSSTFHLCLLHFRQISGIFSLFLCQSSIKIELLAIDCSYLCWIISNKCWKKYNECTKISIKWCWLRQTSQNVSSHHHRENIMFIMTANLISKKHSISSWHLIIWVISVTFLLVMIKVTLRFILMFFLVILVSNACRQLRSMAL